MVSLINTPSILGLGAFLSFTFLSHTDHMYTREKSVFFFSSEKAVFTKLKPGPKSWSMSLAICF